MKQKNNITQQLARRIFTYDDEKGELRHKHRPREMFGNNGQFLNWNARYPGRKVGFSSKPGGYLQTVVSGVNLLCHRIIWTWHYGEIPEGFQVDHINRVRDDNRIENLRLASIYENRHNSGTSKNNTSGHKGVYFRKDTGKWRAEIVVEHKRHNIGTFDTKEEAVEEYVKESLRLTGKFSPFSHK